MWTPEISVIVPTFNSAQTLERAIRSIQNQQFIDLEILVVDDCSEDSTASLIKNLAANDPRIHYFAQDENGGPAIARNRGIAESRGKFIAFLDADDIWFPNKLPFQLNILKSNPEIDLVFTDGTDFNTRTEVERPFSEIHYSVHQQINWDPLQNFDGVYMARGPIRETIYSHCFIQISSVMVKSAAIKDVGGFDSRRFGTEDIDLWVRLAQKHTFAYWNLKSFTHFMSETGLSWWNERWGKELVDYHRTCLTEQSYIDLQSLAVHNLKQAHKSMIAFYGRKWQPFQAMGQFRDSFREIGFDPKLVVYVGMAFLGKTPFNIIYYFSKK